MQIGWSQKLINEELHTKVHTKELYAPRSDTEKATTVWIYKIYILQYMQNEWQSKGQIAGVWYYGWKEQSKKAT